MSAPPTPEFAWADVRTPASSPASPRAQKFDSVNTRRYLASLAAVEGAEDPTRQPTTLWNIPEQMFFGALVEASPKGSSLPRAPFLDFQAEVLLLRSPKPRFTTSARPAPGLSTSPSKLPPLDICTNLASPLPPAQLTSGRRPPPMLLIDALSSLDVPSAKAQPEIDSELPTARMLNRNPDARAHVCNHSLGGLSCVFCRLSPGSLDLETLLALEKGDPSPCNQCGAKGLAVTVSDEGTPWWLE
eukprot:CAMPEP_0114557440 /NCGR_PEP_ID=MMETSP0114-20121206/9834_1 /TAXON_ID=31324 /ORGANISM="Goniomonas sp, Strain m" /LENGTH=243 /DNA_ID=CAMNT_0001742733 /DNA_START=55 /DNA_END=786 /DNA_ORIENTATION=-